MSFEAVSVGILFALICGSFLYTRRVETEARKGRRDLWKHIREEEE